MSKRRITRRKINRHVSQLELPDGMPHGLEVLRVFDCMRDDDGTGPYVYRASTLQECDAEYCADVLVEAANVFYRTSASGMSRTEWMRAAAIRFIVATLGRGAEQ